MKKFFWAIGVLLVVTAAAVLVGPGLIDWNQYKADIQAQVRSVTGRDIHINGDISITVLPAPALIAADVTLANMEGAQTENMVRLKSLEVRVALAPLLGGQVKVERIKLVEPVIELEVLADGRKNWMFSDPATAKAGALSGGNTALIPPPPGSKSAGKAAAPAPDQVAREPALPVALDSLSIENGTLVYRDALGGTFERLEAVNASFSAASLKGPFESSGALKVRGLPLTFSLNVGEIIHARTVPFNVRLGTSAGTLKVQMNGTAVGLGDVPRVKGTVKGEGQSLAALIQAAQPVALPGPLAQPFRFEATIAAGANSAEIKGLDLSLGGARASGGINMTLGQTISIAARLNAGRVDLDQWLGEQDIPAPAASSQAKAPSGSGSAGADGKGKAVTKAIAKRKGPPSFFIPKFIQATLALTADTMTYHGGVVKNGVLNAELANGEITLSQLSAQFPGGSDMALFGFVTAVDGKPRFEGELESRVSDLREVLRWLGTDIDGVGRDRLRKLTLATRILAGPEQVQLSGLDVQFDSSRLTGGVTLALRRRLSFGANIVLNSLNLDAYLPQSTNKPAKKAAGKKASGKKTAPEGSSQNGNSKTAEKAAAGANPFLALKILNTLDANLTATVKAMTYRGAPIKNAVFSGTLYNGKLDIRRLSADRVAGARVSVKGVLDNLGGVPKASGLSLDADTGDVNKVLRFAGLDAVSALNGMGPLKLKGTVDGPLLAPKLKINLTGAGATATVYGQIDGLSLVPAAKNLTLKLQAKNTSKLLKLAGITALDAKQLGPLDVAGRIDGNLLGPDVTLDIKAAGGSAALSGKINTLPVGDTADVSVQLRHPDLARLLRNFSGYRATGPIGGLDMQARLRGGAKEVALTGLTLKAGKTALRGDVVVGLGGARPNIKANLTSGAIVLDPFLPAKKTASLLWPGLKILPVATRRRVASRWSTDAIDLSGLNNIDASIVLKTPSLQYDAYNLQNADLAVVLGNGKFRADKLTGVLFGGALRATASATTTARPRIETVIALENMNVGQATRAFGASAVTDGRMGFQANLATAGGSVAGMIAGLNGNGSLRLKGIDAGQGKTGTMLAGAMGLVTALNQFSGLFGGGGKSGGLMDVSGSFAIQNGLASSRDMQIASSLGKGAAAGTIDLPRWRIDVKGKVNLGQNILTALLSKGTRRDVTQTVPFAVYGPLDSPNIKLDTSKITGGGLPIPGADRLIKKLPKGVGGILQGILGGGTQQQGTTGTQPPPPQSGSEPPPPQPQPQQQRKITPEDLLKQIFRR